MANTYHNTRKYSLTAFVGDDKNIQITLNRLPEENFCEITGNAWMTLNRAEIIELMAQLKKRLDDEVFATH